MLDFNENIYICFFIVMAVLIVGVCAIIIVKQWLKNKRFPVITVRAKISDLNIRNYSGYRNGYQTPGRDSATFHIYYVVFVTENGKQIEFAVRKTQYYKLKKGYSGKLTFQGTKFIRFNKMEGRSAML